MSLFNLPPLLLTLLPLIGAAALSTLVYVLVEPYVNRLYRARGATRLSDLAEERSARQVERERVGSNNHKIRLLFERYGLNVAGQESFYLWCARLGVGAIAFVILLIVGLPPLSSLVAFAMGYVFVNGMVGQNWNKVRSDTESEIPTFLGSLASSLQVAPNVPAGVETVAQTLNQDGPLRAWALELAAAMQAKGVPAAIEEAKAEAEEFSSSLVVVLALIARMHQTGGEGYGKAFISAAENMESVLDARVNARSAGDGERSVLYFLMFGAVALSAISLRNEALVTVTRLPIVQIMYAVIYLLMTYGLTYINDLIDTVV